MAKMSYREALTETLHQEMANDENVIVMGEDVVGGTGSPGGPEAIGGVFGVTGGLFGKYGAERVIDMPISEAGISIAALSVSRTMIGSSESTFCPSFTQISITSTSSNSPKSGRFIVINSDIKLAKD